MSDDVTRTVITHNAPTSGPPSATYGAPNSPAALAELGFEILGELGRGGMGVVYRAFDRKIEREVALKILQENYPPNSATARRFLEEGKITGQLQHPGIPAIHQIGLLPDGRPYLAMKLIKGRTLGELLEEQSPEARKTPHWLAVFEAICQAVGYAHARDVIHRDLKSQNVMVGNFGEVQVMDWGLAKVLAAPANEVVPPTEANLELTEIRSSRDSAGTLTEFGSVMGTLAYMPPEQAGGQMDKVDQRSDVFSLGAILCVILTGKPPYADTNLDNVRLAAIRGDLKDAFARLDASGVEPGLIALAKSCLAFNPSDRPADAGAVAFAVAELRAEAEDRACEAILDRTRAEVQAAELRKRRKVKTALGICVFAALAMIAAGLWRMDHQRIEKERVEASYQNEGRIRAARNRQLIETALDRAQAALGKENPNPGEIDADLTQVEHHLPAQGEDPARTRFAGLKRDRSMLDQLGEINVQRWSRSLDTRAFDTQYARTNYPVVFRNYGIDVGAESAKKLAEKIRRSPIAIHLQTALDAWWGITRDARLLELINTLDPDPERTILRIAFALRDEQTIRERLAKLDGWNLPPSFAQLIGESALAPHAEAIRILTRAQAAHPNHFGLALVTAGRFPREQTERAVGYYRVALSIRPENLACLNNLGSALLESKEVQAAIATFEEVIRRDPNYIPAHTNLGIALKTIDLKRATEEFRVAVRLNPMDCRLHSNLGGILGDNGDVPGAIAEFDEAIRLDPNYANAYRNKGNMLLNQKELDEALKAHQKAVELEPNHSYGHDLLGRALIARGDIDGALAQFQEAIRLDPKNYASYRRAGICLFHKSDVDGAIKMFEVSCKMDPNNPEEHRLLGKAYAAKKEFAKALGEFRKAIELVPKDPVPRYELGNVLHLARDLPGAIAEYQQAIELDRKNPEFYHTLGDALRESGAFQEAMSAYWQALQVNPDFAPAHLHLGLMLGSMKEIDKAINHLKAAVRSDPNYAMAYHNLAMLLVQKGNMDEAFAALKDAVRLKVNFVAAYQALSDHLMNRGLYVEAIDVIRQGALINPGWLSDPQTELRYKSARCAVVASLGEGKDAPPEAGRPALRKQARAWLEEDLTAWKTLFGYADFTKDAKGRSDTQNMMNRWLEDRALAAVRDPAKLLKLPLAERRSWQQFWVEVRTVRNQTSELLPLPREVE